MDTLDSGRSSVADATGDVVIITGQLLEATRPANHPRDTTLTLHNGEYVNGDFWIRKSNE